jgi:hypothetical protein
VMIRRHPAKGPPAPDNAQGGELFRVFGGTTFSHFAYHALFDTKSTLGVKVRQTRWQWLRQRPVGTEPGKEEPSSCPGFIDGTEFCDQRDGRGEGRAVDGQFIGEYGHRPRDMRRESSSVSLVPIATFAI